MDAARREGGRFQHDHPEDVTIDVPLAEETHSGNGIAIGLPEWQ
jgi:hypothetical protein